MKPTVDGKAAHFEIRHFSSSKTEICFLKFFSTKIQLLEYFFSSLYLLVFYGISTIISPSTHKFHPSAYNRANYFFKLFSFFFLLYFIIWRSSYKKYLTFPPSFWIGYVIFFYYTFVATILNTDY
jgi:hypothetical protein